MSVKFLLLLATGVLCTGCVKAVTTTTGAAVGVTKTAVKTTADVSGEVIEAAFDGNKHGHHKDGPRPFDDTRDATADVNAALEAAELSGKNVLLVLGGNWCHDSRGLAGKFEQPELAAVIAASYELVWVDVGYRDRNLDIPARFGGIELFGTPTVLILSPQGELLNRDSVHDWRTADSKPYNETLDYFERFAGSI